MDEPQVARPHFQPDAKIIRSNQFEALVSAEAYVTEMERRAQEVLRSAEELREKRGLEGFEKGYQEGLAKALNELLAVQESAVRIRSQLEAGVIDLVTAATRRIVGELEDHDLIKRMVLQSLYQFQDYRNLRIRISPGLGEAAAAGLEALVRKRLPECNVRVDVDKNLSRHECSLESEVGYLKLDPRVLLDTIAAALGEQVSPLHRETAL